MNQALSCVFKSQASYAVIHCLAFCMKGVSLRQIAYRTNLGLRSVQLALAYLEKVGVVKFSIENLHEKYSLNLDYPGIQDIQDITRINFNSFLIARSKILPNSLASAISFSDQANKFIKISKQAN